MSFSVFTNVPFLSHAVLKIRPGKVAFLLIYMLETIAKVNFWSLQNDLIFIKRNKDFYLKYYSPVR